MMYVLEEHEHKPLAKNSKFKIFAYVLVMLQSMFLKKKKKKAGVLQRCLEIGNGGGSLYFYTKGRFHLNTGSGAKERKIKKKKKKEIGNQCWFSVTTYTNV